MSVPVVVKSGNGLAMAKVISATKRLLNLPAKSKKRIALARIFPPER
jgi:hypothetical protein